jgi:uncharacterized protein YjdB
VCADGLVRAVSKGKTTLRAISEDGNKTATCVVTVVVPVEGISLERCPGTLVLGSQEQWGATVEPAEANNQALTWTSDDSEVATVDSAGLVSAHNPGEVTISVRSQEDSEKTESCRLTVVVPIGSVSIGGCLTTSLTPGNTRALTATVEPANATDKDMTWSSSNTAVATVNSNGVVTAGNTGGTAIITASTEDGNHKNFCAVTVTVPAAGVSIGECATTALTPGNTRQLTATVAPAGATNRSVTWISSNTSVAIVNVTTGLVTAGSTGGTATITARVNDSNITATCNVTVTIPVSSVSLAPCPMSVRVGGSNTGWATIAPANATNKGVTWSSNDPAVTLNASGTTFYVKGAHSGKTTITVRTNDGGKTASCVVSARPNITRVVNSGCAGDIYGFGFNNVQGATVGGQPAAFHIMSQEMIRIGINAGGGRVIVTANGVSDISYYARPGCFM